MTALPNDAQDNSFAVLNAYLEELHAGGRPARAQLLAEHPQLAEALECLEALEKLAAPPSLTATPPANGAAAPEPSPDAPTVAGPSPSDPPPEWPVPAGEFGKYELLCELGRGGMGVVYKARQKDLDRPVALKMILAGHLASPDVVHRFHDEARAAAGLHHPHIVAVYEAGHVHGQPYFAMQYIGGPSLAEVLRREPMSQEEAVRCVAVIARAVAHLHGKGIVHRDLKPSNILLDEAGTPYVTDFGLVKMLQADSRKTTTGVILGTPSYMAPEQAAGRAQEVGPLSDVYALGAILYECLTGRPPFREATPLDTLVQVLEGEPLRPRQLNPQVPRDLETVCLKCLEKAPEERYPSADALADDLERHLNGEEIEAQGAGVASRLRRWARREPALSSRLIVLAVCCVVIQVNYQVGRRVELGLHLRALGLFALWGLISVIFQRLLNRKQGQGWIPFAWAAADMVVLEALLLNATSDGVTDNALDTPFLVAFPLLITAAGLWFRVAVVWFTTALAVLAYGILLAYHLIESGVRIRAPHQQVIFAVALCTVGFIIAYQVKRVRALSRYYEHRPLP